MSTSLAYHTQGIIGFQHKSFVFSEKNNSILGEEGTSLSKMLSSFRLCLSDKRTADPSYALWQQTDIFQGYNPSDLLSEM